MPFWAMSMLSLVPVWGFLYLRGVQPQPERVSGPLAVGEEVYPVCAACHAGNGSGGTGRAFWNGEVLKTFPKIEDQLNFVYNGSQGYSLADIGIIGDPNREGGPHVPLDFGVMPAQGETAGGALTELQILGVVCHERYKLGGADPTSEEWEAEYEEWCSPEALRYEELKSGLTFDSEEFAEVGTAPRLATP
jgi:hypothetical protein